MRTGRSIERGGRRENGTAVLIVLTLAGAMSLFIMANCTTLSWMKQEILRIEERQRRWGVREEVRGAPGGRAAAPAAAVEKATKP